MIDLFERRPWGLPGTAFLVCLILTCSPVSALVVAGGNGTTTPPDNTVAPDDNPYWDHVGWNGFGTDFNSRGSAVYIGNGMVLTASHAFGSNITLGTDDPSGGMTYNLAPGGVNQNLLNTNNNSASELRIFEISGDPGLPTVPIYDQTLTEGTALMMIGTGVTRDSAEMGYDFTGSPAGIDANGYDWSATRDKTWGTNTVSEVDAFSQSSIFNDFWSFSAEFNDLDGEAQAGDKDSGGAVFAYDETDNRWELAGIMTAITTLAVQDANDNIFRQELNTSLYGQSTIFIDLTRYSDQINALIPEPTSLALLAAGGLMGMARRRTRR